MLDYVLYVWTESAADDSELTAVSAVALTAELGETRTYSISSSQLTKDFFNVSKELAYNIFFLILAESGHQDIRNSFCFLELSVVPCERETH